MKSSGASKRKPTIKSKDFKPGPNQQKLTQFFKPPGVDSVIPGPVMAPVGRSSNGNFPSTSSKSNAPMSATTKSNMSKVESKAGNIPKQRQIPSSSLEDDDVILLSSDSEPEPELETQKSKKKDAGSTGDSTSRNDDSSCNTGTDVAIPATDLNASKLEESVTSFGSKDEVLPGPCLPQLDEITGSQEKSSTEKPTELSPSSSTSTEVLTPPAIITETQEIKLSDTKINEEPVVASSSTSSVITMKKSWEDSEPGPSFGSDSEDEILSQLDIDEIISSQENSGRKSQLSQASSTSSQVLTPVINQTPMKLARQKINRFSTVQRLNSRSPARGGRNSSGSSSSGSKSSSGKKSLTGSAMLKTPDHQGTLPVSTVSPTSVVKKLQFPDTPSKSTFTPFVPYFLRHWSSMLDSVTSDPLNSHLLDDSDRSIIAKFLQLSLNAKCLFVRLFTRKWEWKIASSIKYPKIQEDLTSVFEELHDAGLLVEIRDVQGMLELQAVLEILNGEQIAALAKQMNANSKIKTKKGLTSSLLALSKTKSVFATSSTSSLDSIIRNRALELMGRCYQVEGTCRAMFSRMFIMHSPPQYWEDEQDQSSNQLFKMFLTDDGTMLYPQYRINKTTSLYKDRGDLIRFHEAWTLHCNISTQMESKDYEEVIKIGENALSLLRQILDDPDVQSHDQSIPQFLRMYKSGSVLTRVLWLSVEGHQKLKQYEAATEHIDLLLSQKIYLTQYRGRWYERLVMNQKQYLKLSQEKRRETFEIALRDEFLLDSHKLCISERFEKLLQEIQKPPKKKSKKIKKVKRNEEEDMDTDEEYENQDPQTQGTDLLYRLNRELPTRTIQGEKLFNPAAGKSVFVTQQDARGSSDALSVELFAISQYKASLGYPYGIHCEGAVVCSLFGLLFWDEIYSDEIDDTFHSQFQVQPLDLNFDDFFIRREGIILDKLEGMRSSWSIEYALNLLETNWNKHNGELSLVNWNIPSDAELAIILKRLGLPVVAAICERLARNFRHWRSGFPDLVLWNDKDAMFVEVKGPGDTLSYKQRVWIDFLLSIGAKAEVCHVQAVSNKKIKT